MSNRYQFRPPQRRASGLPGLTPMVQRLMIANGVVFLLQLYFGEAMSFYLGVVPELLFQRGMLWQPFTYMWLHGGFFHLFINMLILWMMGGTIELTWGSRRFLKFYLQCGIGAGVLILLWNSMTPSGMQTVTVGASGAIYGLLTAFALTWPDRTIVLLPIPIPIKAIWLIPVLFFMQLMLGGGNISHIGHLGGVLVAGVLLRGQVRQILGFRSLRYRWHRLRMRGRLRSVRRDEFERRRQSSDDDDRPTFH